MNILYHHRIASKDGQYVHIEEIIKSFKKNGERVTIVAPGVAEKQSFGGDGGWVSKLKAKLPGAIYEVLELAYSVLAFIKLSVAIVKDKPDFIYERYNLLTPAGIWAKKLFGIPLVLEINAPLYEERSKYHSISMPKIAKWSQTYVWNNADVVLPVTQVLADIVKEYGVSCDKIEVIHNGIDQSKFKPNTTNLKDSSEKLTVGFVGFVREWHKLEYIVDLIAKDKTEKLNLLIVGDGPAIEGIKKQAFDLGVQDRVEITGLISRDEMPGQLSKIDIAIQPSVVEYASPLKMIEYLGSGLAIVAPAQNNIKELLTDRHNALLFEPENTEDCAARIAELTQDTELMNRLSLAAKNTIEQKNLLWDANATRITTIAGGLVSAG